MKDLKAQRGRLYLQKMIAQGEHERQDFKFSISDASKIARSISAFANCHGGHLLIGVKDNGTVAGVRNEEDIYVVEQAAQMYCQPAQDVEFTAFRYDAGINVIRATVAQAIERPVRARDIDGSWKAYFRVADENILAHPLMVRVWERSRHDNSCTAMRLDGTAQSAIEIARQQPLSPEQLMLRLHLSQQKADELVVNLLTLGLLEFTHTHHGFLLTVCGDDDASDTLDI